ILNFEHEKQHFDTLRFALSQDSTILKYVAGVKSRAIVKGKEKATYGAMLYGSFDGGTLSANYLFRDRNNVVAMRAGVSATMQRDGLLFRFAPNATLFRQPFKFNKDNEIFLSREMEIRGNIELRDTTNSGLNLYASSDSLQQQDIGLELFNIDLQSVTKILPFAPDLAGIMNIDVHYNKNGKNILLGSDATVAGLVYEGTLIGNERLELSYFPKSSQEHLANLTMLHNDHEVATLTGSFLGDTISKGQGKLTLARLPLSIANAFLKKSNISTDGYIDGAMNISSENNIPVANGYIKFDSAHADLPSFGTTLHLVDDKVNIEDNILKFENFDIYAKGNTPFKVNGTIDMNTPLNPDFNLRMRANNYEIVNSKRTKNSILYGRMFINLNSRITGSFNTLAINGSTTILGKSDITYVIQDTPLETENSLDGLVTFTNFQDTAKVETVIPDYNLGDIKMNLTLSIEEGARINADFDRERTSYIELQGEGNLNLTYTGETGMNLTGRYQLSNGQMKYTLPVIPLKTFNINQGSYINWTGDIMNPTLNITAVERVITSVLIDDIAQAVQFDVGVKLTNSLNNMGLSFTLSAPENAAVQNQLNTLDNETLNKYALTMLITGAYIGGANNLSVSSALSSFLDAQINNLVGNAMNRTVDINVGITDLEDATTGDTYKNYSFSFTKRFWNDRLKVIIGGEVNNNANATANESFINNVSLEWKISNSGNRYLRLFYDKNYESILEGEIIETGVGYVYKRKLNNLNELLIFNKKNKQPATPPLQRPVQPEENRNKEKEHNK
ncbi:MAG: translocation/assembly module TamB domain-containing protein, partial [Bacteroidaceae bacterium]|nr:translocation/assembly module TamB domain-containing protein [Bacteroidaceae bacterium]